MDIVIVDDEANAREIMQLLLAKISPDLRVVGEASSVREASLLLKGLEFDILLLDVEMMDGTGFDVIEEYPNINASVIFTTAHNDYALEAIRKNALDYLLKPINLEELRAAIAKCVPRPKRKVDFSDVLNTLRSELRGVRVSVTGSNVIDFVNSNDVIYCESEGAYSTVLLRSGKKLVTTRSLKYFEEAFEQASFFRINKSNLINLDQIRQYRKDIGFGQVTMGNGDILKISRRKRAEFNKEMKGL